MDTAAHEESIKIMLAGEDYFTCERTHCRLSIESCVKRQAQGVGIRALNGYLIPDQCRDCEQGKHNKEAMKMASKKGTMKKASKKGTCENCERTDLVLPAGGLCGTCYKAARWLPVPERIEALAKVRERVIGVPAEKLEAKKVDAVPEPTNALEEAGPGPVINMGGKGLQPHLEAIVAEIMAAMASSQNKNVPRVILDFKTVEDRNLFIVLSEDAYKNRRTLAQHARWCLEAALPAPVPNNLQAETRRNET